MKALGMFVIKWESRSTSRGQYHQGSVNGPKDKDSITNKGGFIYMYKCDHLGCIVKYIGKTGRTFGDRYKEHLRAPYL